MRVPTRICHYPRRDGPLPVGAKWVGRPSRWGNPWKPATAGTVLVPVLARMPDGRRSTVAAVRTKRFLTLDDCLTSYLVAAATWMHDNPKRYREPLLDAHYLACACPLEQRCHVDILISLLTAAANGQTVPLPHPR